MRPVNKILYFHPATHGSGFAETTCRCAGPVHGGTDITQDDGAASYRGHVIHCGDLHCRVQGLSVAIDQRCIIWCLSENIYIMLTEQVENVCLV